MNYGGTELAEAFRTVRKNTIQIAEDIPWLGIVPHLTRQREARAAQARA